MDTNFSSHQQSKASYFPGTIKSFEQEISKPSSSVDFKAAAKFLASFGATHTFQLIPESPTAKAAKSHPKLLHGTFEENAGELARANTKGYGVFFTVNETDLKGRKQENIVRVRSVFLDLDGSPLEPVLAASFKPHLILETSPGRYHAYWLVDGLGLEEFSQIQKTIITRFNGDRSIHDLPRVMRIPGFYHQKKEVPFKVRVHEENPDLAPYTADQVKAEFLQCKDEVPDKAVARLRAKSGTKREPSPNKVVKRSIDGDSPSARYMRDSIKVAQGDGQGSGHSSGHGSLQSDYQASFFPKALNRCSFLRHCVDDAQDLPEPYWYACCSNIVRCIDGDKDGRAIFHEISEPHPGYSSEETDRKIDHALSEGKGPHTCSYIAGDLGFEGCASCQWRKFNTSPVQLGTSRFDDELLCALEQVNLNYAAVMMGGSFRILREATDEKGRTEVSFLRRDDFMGKFANRNVKTLGDKKMLEVNVAKEWLAWRERREYEGVVFSPGKEIPNQYNLYHGMVVEPTAGDWSLMREHIRTIICSSNDEIFKYLLDYLARIVQKPGSDRPGVAIILKGEQGTGKGIFVENFGNIFGDHYRAITQGDHLTGKFNAHLANALIVFVDEGYWAGDKNSEGVLKGLITEPRFVVEGKGRDQITVANHMNIFMASNNDWVVPAGKEERRFLVLDVSNARRQDFEYFAAIQEQMDSGGREAMLYELLHRDIQKVNLRKIPKTSALLDQKLRSLDPVGRFWHDRLTHGFVITAKDIYGKTLHEDHTWPTDQVAKSEVYAEYESWCRRAGQRYLAAPAVFWKKVKELCPSMDEKRGRTGGGNNRVFKVTFPPLEQCLIEFHAALGWEYEPEGSAAENCQAGERTETPQSVAKAIGADFDF